MLKRLAVFLTLLPSVIFASSSTVHSYHLHNGLTLYVQVNKRAPVVLSQVWYKVGGAYEYDGVTGISHVLEHLMFQGTQNTKPGEFSQIISDHGGIQNAMTDFDFTVYYQELPSRYLDIAFQLESDRMDNLLLTQKNLTKEMGVVKTEKRLRIDDSPQTQLLLALFKEAFTNAPYHHPIIGWQKDLDNMNLTEVKKWYKTWYSPNNAILVVVGEVNPDQVYQLAQQYFGKIPPEKVPSTTIRTQKPSGPKTFTLNIPAKLPMILIGFNVPSYNTTKNKQDLYALAVLAEILAGDDSSIFENQLIRQEHIAVGAEAHYDPFMLHSSLFYIGAVPANNVTLKQLNSKILSIIQQLQEKPISTSQLRRAKVRIMATKVYSLDSLAAQANQIGSLEAVGIPWQVGKDFVKNIENVSTAEVQNAARTYLTPARMTTGYLVPSEPKGETHASI